MKRNAEGQRLLTNRSSGHIGVELKPRTWIDEALVPLVETLWEQGYETYACCQGGEKYDNVPYPSDAYISFASFDDGVRFMRHVWATIGTRNYYVNHGMYKLEVGDNYGYPSGTGKLDRSLGPTGCVRFPPEIEGWDIIQITTDAFLVGDVAPAFTKEKEPSKV